MFNARDTVPRQGVLILRFWETRSDAPDAPATWHFSTQDPQSGERRGFADLKSLMDFLASQTEHSQTTQLSAVRRRLMETVAAETDSDHGRPQSPE